MRYPVMTEKHLADRWQVSLKTLRRWRLDNEGPVWHKLFRHVRYHEADILEFEHRSSQHLMTLLGINREFKPEQSEATQSQGLDAEAENHYFTAKEIAGAGIRFIPSHDRMRCRRDRLCHRTQVSACGIACGRRNQAARPARTVLQKPHSPHLARPAFLGFAEFDWCVDGLVNGVERRRRYICRRARFDVFLLAAIGIDHRTPDH